MKNRILYAIILILPFTNAIADEYRSKINDGYDYYKNGEYEKAADNFKQAAILKPDRALPLFDKGTALYKSNDYEGAAKEFGSTNGKIDNKDIKSDSYYNMGNALFKAGKYDDAIKSYVDALKLNPKDKDYKHNLETALIKKQIQQQQQQQQKQDQNKDKNKDQQKQDQQKQDQQKQDQQKKDQQQNQQDQKKDEQKDQQQAGAQDKKMSKEQAQRLLAQFAEDEKEIQKQLKQVNLRSRSRNDW